MIIVIVMIMKIILCWGLTTRNTIPWDNKKNERREIGRRRLRWCRKRLRLRRLITRWPFSVWTARWPRNRCVAGDGGDGDGDGGDRKRAMRPAWPVPVARGVVLPETGGASDRPVSWPRRPAAGQGPAPTVGRPLRTRSAGLAVGLLAVSTRSSLPSAALAFPFGCENNVQTESVRNAQLTGARA